MWERPQVGSLIYSANLRQQSVVRWPHCKEVVTELDPQTQVCRYLHRLADERRTRVVNPGVSQSELALVLGLHRSTVCRIIRTLRDRGVLGHFTRCSLEILDREALAELCNPSEGGK